MFLIGLPLFYVESFPTFALATQTEAITAITSAEDKIIDCYQATLDAEKNGANVTSLVNVLNATIWSAVK